MSGKMSKLSQIFEKPWLAEFEKESVNNENWSCIVTAFIETKAEDEEYIQLLRQCVTNGEIPLIQIIAQSDLTDLMKNYEKPLKNKNKTELKDVNESEKKFENDGNGHLYSAFDTSSRFPQVLSLISDYAEFSEGEFRMPPAIMAYALKYIILEKKDKNYYKKRVVNFLGRKEREENIKTELIRNLNGFTKEKCPGKKDECSLDKLWSRKKFDILEGSPSRHGPYNGPDIYIVLSGFYDPLYFVQLLKINVPFVAVIKLENCKPIFRSIPGNSNSKKMQLINYFWTELDKGVAEGNATAMYNEMALLKFTPSYSSDHSTEEKTIISINGMIALLYTVYNLYRLHKTFIQNMEVQRMIECLERLELSRCKIYNQLCDALITDNANAEIFVLFSMIEQVVVGIPPTRERILEYKRQSSEFFQPDINAIETISTIEVPQGTNVELSVNLDLLTDTSGRRDIKNNNCQISYPNIYLYDDVISLATPIVDQNILKNVDLIKRFIINPALLKLQSKYPVLSKAEKTESDFQFFSIWEKSKENQKNFKIKLFFSIVMRLIERIHNSKESSQDFSFQGLESKSSTNSDKDKKELNFLSLPEINTNSANFFQQLDDLFYKETEIPAPKQEFKFVQKSTTAKLELRKGIGALTGLLAVGGDSSEDLDILCDRCPSIKENQSTVKREGDDGIHLVQLLESYKISNLNEPNLLINREGFNNFVQGHKFYELLEPNRIVQRLQQLYDNYNTNEWTYFSPTDTLFVLGYNDTDFRGVHHSQDYGYIASPVSLRDFCIYILPKNGKWVKQENSEFINFLESIAQNAAAEEKRKENQLKCEFLSYYCTMSEAEKENFLSYERNQIDCDDRDSKRKNSTENWNIKECKELEDLPKKVKRPRPKQFCFKGINSENAFTSFTVSNSEFHSKDGSLVRARTVSWLRAGQLVTVIVQRSGSKLYLNRLVNETILTESLHFEDSSGVLFTFDAERSIPFLSKITRPNGLTIQPISINGNASLYIKQQYSETYRLKQNLINEIFRCYLSNGQMLIFNTDETVSIFCPSGTRYHCRVRLPNNKEKLNSKWKNGKEKKINDKFCIKIENVIRAADEIYYSNEFKKFADPLKKISSLVDFDAFNGEIFYRTKDGTDITLWPDGKLVTCYPDGTKITSEPELEKYKIFSAEVSEPESTGGKRGENFDNESFRIEESEAFSVVTCSYLFEHPKYATVFSKKSLIEIRKVGKTNVTLSPTGDYIIRLRNSILKSSSEGAHFYNFCECSDNKSSSIIRLHSPSQNIICDTHDFFNKRFIVYDSGRILYESDREDRPVPEGEEEISKSFISVDQQKPPECCRHCRNCSPRQACLIFERDLTGMEFIEENSLYRYIGTLSENAYYDLFRISEDGSTIHHGFFQPMDNPLSDGNIIEYEKNDAYPIRVKTRRETEESSDRQINMNDSLFKKKERPKAVIARFIRVLPLDPIDILQKITIAIYLCQQKASNVSEHYKQLSKFKYETPFKNHINEQLQFIATSINLFKPLHLYPHTCITFPYTEFDIHSAIHNQNLNNYFEKIDPNNFQPIALPRCRQIRKPFKHYGRDKDISEDPENDPNL